MSYSDVLMDHPAIGRPVSELITPAALVDLDWLEANIARMAAFFADKPAQLRPHVKTHRAPAIARMQIAAGGLGVTCAKVSMAEAMADGGIADLFIANQVVSPPAIRRLAQLATRTRVAVAADDAGNVANLSAAAMTFGSRFDVLIEVDAGMGRCGTQPGEPTLALAKEILRLPGLRFKGLHVYEGHVVQNDSREVRQTETVRMLERTMETRDLLQRKGLEVEVVTCGGTGTYDISGVYPGVTEHQSGSYVYMDSGYDVKTPGFHLALSILCTVLSRPVPHKVVTDGGVQVMANDYGKPLVKSRPEILFRALSEEHGNFLVREGDVTDLKVGDQVEVHPGHCCSCANLHDQVYAVRGGNVEAVFKATARGKSQ